MAKREHRYVCQSCGAVHARWAGRCDDCGAWNALAEETAPKPVPKSLGGARGQRLELADLAGRAGEPARRSTGIDELDRVLGGGLVRGSAILIGGDPGIGKSTLVLQAAARLAREGAAVAYVSGEESVAQIRLRAARLGLQDTPVKLLAASAVADLIATFDHADAPDLLVIDSIQTMYVEALDSAPGTVTQVRTAALELIRFAKRRRTALALVGHVTKEGQIAGPRVLEHMVDAVLYFEGDRGHQFRILRAVKNRFGAANEIGVFEMGEVGLVEVPNPSALFLAEREGEVAGSAVFAGIEGSRPILVEVQALVAPGVPGSPRRTVVGWDQARLAMLLAVLEARAGLGFGDRDVYLNIAGGLRVAEPAGDLAVAGALISSRAGRALPAGTVTFGEVGLAGEVRRVGRTDERLREAAKLGFEQACLPPAGLSGEAGTGLRMRPVGHLLDLRRLIDHRAN